MRNICFGKISKKILLIILIFSIIFIYNNQSFAINLSDINNHWAKEYINYMTEKGAISGYPDGTFKPQNTVKVGESIKLIVSTFNKNVANSTSGHWAKNYLIAAKNLQIINSSMYSENSLNDSITRKEVILMVYESLNKLAYRPLIENSQYIMPLSDVIYNPNEDNVKYYEAIKACYLLGIVQGNDEKLMNPNDYITRAEIVTILSRAYSSKWRVYPTEDTINVTKPSSGSMYRKIWPYMTDTFYDAGVDTWMKYVEYPSIFLDPYERICTNEYMLNASKTGETAMEALLNVSYNMSEDEWNTWKNNMLLFKDIMLEDFEEYKQYVMDNEIDIRGGVVLNPCTIGKLTIEEGLDFGIKGYIKYKIVSNPNNKDIITYLDYIKQDSIMKDNIDSNYVLMYSYLSSSKGFLKDGMMYQMQTIKFVKE